MSWIMKMDPNTVNKPDTLAAQPIITCLSSSIVIVSLFDVILYTLEFCFYCVRVWCMYYVQQRYISLLTSRPTSVGY